MAESTEHLGKPLNIQARGWPEKPQLQNGRQVQDGGAETLAGLCLGSPSATWSP